MGEALVTRLFLNRFVQMVVLQPSIKRVRPLSAMAREVCLVHEGVLAHGVFRRRNIYIDSRLMN